MGKKKEFAVLGLGKFGISLAKCLSDAGCEVMVVDTDSEMVNIVADYVVHAEVGDVTNRDFIETLGLSNYDGVIVGIGDNLEAGVMATILAKEAGAVYVLAKAGSELHARILKKVGADKIIYPEMESGRRIANQLVHGNYFDVIELSTTYSIMEIDAPDAWAGYSFKTLNLRAKYNVNVIGIRRDEETFINPSADMPIYANDVLVVIGDNDALEKLSSMTKDTEDK